MRRRSIPITYAINGFQRHTTRQFGPLKNRLEYTNEGSTAQKSTTCINYPPPVTKSGKHSASPAPSTRDWRTLAVFGFYGNDSVMAIAAGFATTKSVRLDGAPVEGLIWNKLTWFPS